MWVDGTSEFTEIVGGHVSRWTPDGGVERVADTGGGPNGAAAAADGALYVTQNGGMGTGGRRRRASSGSRPTARSRWSRTEVGRRAASTGRTTWPSAPTGGCGSPTRAATPTRPKNSRPGRIFALDVVDGRGRAGRRARAGVPERHRLPRRRHARVERVVQPADHAARRRAPEVVVELPRAPLPRRLLRRRRRHALYVAHDVRPLRERRAGRRDRRQAAVRRRHGHELLLRRDRPLRHRFPQRHAVALRLGVGGLPLHTGR